MDDPNTQQPRRTPRTSADVSEIVRLGRGVLRIAYKAVAPVRALLRIDDY
jgi:hypothetical protein